MAKFNVFLTVLIVASGVALAVSDDEKALKEALQPNLDECRDKFDITREQALAAKEAKDITFLDSCFYACFFKNIGFITDDGLFDADAAMEQNKKYIKGAENLKSMNDIIKTCTSVNERSVTDGDQGCDRSRMLLGCIIKEIPSISYFNY